MATYVNTPDEKRYIFYPAHNNEFKFKVCCGNDCHVALSNEPHENTPMYEIAIGGWRNTKSIIRLIGKAPDLAAAATPGIVDNNELRGFWVRWNDDTISVGREGENVPFMSHGGPKLFAVEYVGICTAFGSSGSWLFDDPNVNGAIPHIPTSTNFNITKNMKFVKTPNDYRFKYYPARGEIFRFYVCCANDCHVSLSTRPYWVQPIYDMTIGGWTNTKSVISFIGKENYPAAASTPGIVNANEMRGFWVSWNNNMIHVGRVGETVSFMSYRDENLFAVKYVGICTSAGSSGTWLINETPAPIADVPATPNIIGTNLKKVNTPNEKRYIFYPAHGTSFLFKVRCDNDCHVALTTNPRQQLPMYEIVIGGWANTKSVIRQIGKTPDLIEVSTISIVNPREMRTFWVRWQDNVIQVGRGGEDVAFMTYKDPNLFHVQYVGVCTAFGSTGSWLIDETRAVAVDQTPSMILEIKTPKEKIYKYYPIRDGIFNFKVKCSNDCYVALSAQPLEGLPMYEIVIGGWDNIKSVIREIGKEPAEVVEISTHNIVNSDEFRGFWIRWKDNNIAVGREGEDNAFMSHKDPKLFPITYVGISTGFGSIGTWLFQDNPTACSI